MLYLLASEPEPVALGLDAASLISLAIGTVLPLLVGLVTKRTTNANLKAVLLLLLSVASGFLSTILSAVNANVPFDWITALVTAAVTFGTGVAAHYGFWKPTGASGAVADVGVTSSAVEFVSRPALDDLPVSSPADATGEGRTAPPAG